VRIGLRKCHYCTVVIVCLGAMTTKELLMVTLFAVASVILITGRVVSASSWSEDVDQDPSMPSRRRRDSGTSDVVVSGASADGRRSWTVRRRVAPANVSSSSTASRVTPEQWRHRERSVTTSSVTAVQLCLIFSGHEYFRAVLGNRR